MRKCGAKVVKSSGETEMACNRPADHDGYHHFVARRGAYRFGQ